MNFFVYHQFDKSLCFILSHNLENRIIDEKSNTVTGYYKNIPIKFIFSENFVEDNNSYHILFRHYSAKKYSLIEELSEKITDLRIPEVFAQEYEIILNKLDFNYRWILFWNFGENMFVHLGQTNIENSEEIDILKTLSEKVLFFTDNLINDNFNLNKNNFKNCLTNDFYFWNAACGFPIINDYYDIHKRLSFEYKLGISFRNKTKHRLNIESKLKLLNRDDIFINQNQKNDIDFKDYSILMGIGHVGFGLDYYLKYLNKASVHLLDETHSSNFNKKIPFNLTEKTYLFLLGGIPFIPTNVYPLNCISELIGGSKYPFFNDVYLFDESQVPLIDFIKKFLENFDEMYPKIQSWVDDIREILINRVTTENSFLEKIINEIH